MKAFVLFCLLSQVLAGPSKPDITIGLSSDALDKNPLEALEPHINWQTSGEFSGFDVEGGISLKVKDVDDTPYSIWGRVKRTVGDINLSAKVDTNSGNMNMLGLDLQASAPSGTSLQVTGTANTDEVSLAVANIQVSQKIDTDLGAFVVTPKYNVPSKKADLKLSYGRDDTFVTINANTDKQKVTVSQAIGDGNVLSPSFSSDGDVELEYTRSIGTGALTASYKPDSHVGLTYEDGPWVASLRTPLDGIYKLSKDVKFGVRRSIDVTTLGSP